MQEFINKLNAIQQQHALAANYAKTLLLLQALKAGDLSLDNLTLTVDGWQVAPAEEPAAPRLAEPPLE